jgi:tetratricopeptide (TPR) repeat protein
MMKWSDLSKMIKVVVMAAGLLCLSELAYLARHQELSKPWVGYYLRKVEADMAAGEVRAAMMALEKASEWQTWFLSRYYSKEILPEKIVAGEDWSDKVWTFKTVWEGMGAEKLMESEGYGLAYLFYRMGVTAFAQGELSMAGLWLQQAVRLNPEASFFQVEWANYLMQREWWTQAGIAMDECKLFVNPRAHCEDFWKSDVSMGNLHSVGFLGEEVKEYYGF